VQVAIQPGAANAETLVETARVEFLKIIFGQSFYLSFSIHKQFKGRVFFKERLGANFAPRRELFCRREKRFKNWPILA
jgi:hypothetical protein